MQQKVIASGHNGQVREVTDNRHGTYLVADSYYGEGASQRFPLAELARAKAFAEVA